MDPIEAIGAVIGVLTFAGTIAGAVKAYGAMQQRVKDQDSEIADTKADIAVLMARVEKAEGAAQQTGKLADAVETMGEKFASEIKHLAEVWTLNHQHTREQLNDIRAQLKKGP